MKYNYKACLEETLKWEGGYSNHPSDPGGATQRGVTQQRYNEYRADRGLPSRHVRSLTETELQDIYRRYYWDVVRGDDLPSGVDLAVFDFAVNSGPSRAAKYLQDIVGVKQDGVIGTNTLTAVSKHSPTTVATRLCDNRLAFVKRLSTWPVFGKGWSRRISGIRQLAIEMAGSTNSTRRDPLSQNTQNVIVRFITWLVSFLKS